MPTFRSWATVPSTVTIWTLVEVSLSTFSTMWLAPRASAPRRPYFHIDRRNSGPQARRRQSYILQIVECDSHPGTARVFRIGLEGPDTMVGADGAGQRGNEIAEESPGVDDIGVAGIGDHEFDGVGLPDLAREHFARRRPVAGR